jgi:hypothetical protein
MIRFYIPWSLGKNAYIDPYTFVPKIDHPYLIITADDISLKEEIYNWMTENFGYSKLLNDIERKCLFLDFEDEKDLSLFLLRWQ